MKKLFAAILLMIALTSQSAMISFQMTNSVSGLPDTNVIQVFSCGPVQADGTVYTTGIGKRIKPDTNGYAVTWLEQNNYLATNAYLGRGYIFRAPLDSSSNNVYNSAGPSCLISGLNYFVNLVVGDATNQNVTLNQITNALGFTPLSPMQVTNVTQGVTNGFTSIVYSNPASFTSAQTVTGIVQSLSPSFAQSTNIANQAASNAVSIYTTTNQFTYGTNWVSTNLISYTLAQGLAGTNFTLSTSNSLFTNLTSSINTSSNALKSFLNDSNAALASSIASTSNGLWLAKQPASTILSNLALTGAFTNTLAAGQNVTLTTNLTAPIIYINATNQSFLTNGFTSIVYSNGSTFVTTNMLVSATNGILQSQWTNNLGSAAYMPSSAFDTNGSASAVRSAIISSNYLVASATNWLASTNYVNAATNGFVTQGVTNGLASISFVTNSIQAATNGMASAAYVSTNAILVWSTNAANAVYSNNPAGYSTVAQLNSSSNFLSTNLLAQIAATNRANLIITTNLVVASTNAGNIVFTNDPRVVYAVTNSAQFQIITNGFAQGSFGLGTHTNFLISTNLIGVTGAGSTQANGTYLFNQGGFANTWTNFQNTALNILLSSGTFYIQSNSVSLYSAASVTGPWAKVNGQLPNPTSAYGSYWDMNGVVLDGPVVSSNIVWQISMASTNFILSGVVQSWTTNNQFSTAGTNVIMGLIAQYGINPTNGVSALTVTNIAASMINEATNSLWAATTNRGSVTWGTETNFSSFARPMGLYYFVTNGIPQYGILYTN